MTSRSGVPPRVVVTVAGITAGLAMAGLLMVLEWAGQGSDPNTGFWAFPTYVAAALLRTLQDDPYQGFLLVPVVTGIALHLVVSVALTAAFVGVARRLDLDALMLRVLGVAYGLVVFVIMWMQVLPHADPALLRLDPTYVAATHVVWGLAVGGLTASQTLAPGGAPLREPPPDGGRLRSLARLDSLHAPWRRPAASSDGEAPGGAPRRPGSARAQETVEDAAPRPVHRASRARAASAEELPAPPDEENASGPASAPAPSNLSAASGPLTRDLLTRTAAARLKELRAAVAAPSAAQRALGARLARIEVGRAMVLLDADDRLHNAAGSVHGGAIASLAELAADFAIETVTDAGRATKLLDHNVHHVHRVKRARLIAEARVVDRTGRTVLVDVSVRTGDGTPIARSRLTALVT